MSNMLAGKVWKFGDNINTDLMLPGPYLFRGEKEQATAVFLNSRPEWLGAMKPGDAIIGGFNYGMGSSRPAASSTASSRSPKSFVSASAIFVAFAQSPASIATPTSSTSARYRSSRSCARSSARSG